MKKILAISILFFISTSMHAQRVRISDKATYNGIAGAGFIAIGGVGLLYASYQTNDASAVRDFSRISYGCFIVGGVLEMFAFSNLVEASNKKVAINVKKEGLTLAMRF